MTTSPGALLTLEIEKPAAGGRMIARHQGQIVLVSGAIPGEQVQARVERTGKGVIFAEAVDVVTASPDRRDGTPDWRCGGNVLAHIAYPRQLQLKGEIIRDALGRIGRVPLAATPEVIGSPEQGYRMRARLHADHGRLGFYREGTHQLCDPATTGQLLPSTLEWIEALERLMRDQQLHGLVGLELTENVSADQRACHLELHGGVHAGPFAALTAAGALTGVSAERADRQGVEVLFGEPFVVDVLNPGGRGVDLHGPPVSVLHLRRDVRAFFQGNRYLLDRLVQHVMGLVPDGPVVDLYAGVGLFGLSLAAAGRTDVTLVENDPVAGADLQRNADPFRAHVQVLRTSVEAFVHSAGLHGQARPTDVVGSTYIVDPPRTGISRDALAGIIAQQPARLVYVSCDVATLARDARTLIDAGYELGSLTGLDLFPNTAHVETVVVFRREGAH